MEPELQSGHSCRQLNVVYCSLKRKIFPYAPFVKLCLDCLSGRYGTANNGLLAEMSTSKSVETCARNEDD